MLFLCQLSRLDLTCFLLSEIVFEAREKILILAIPLPDGRINLDHQLQIPEFSPCMVTITEMATA
jgi:hypothetical protein